MGGEKGVPGFDLMKRQHLEILAAGDRLLGLVQGEAPERLAAVAKCRMELSRLVHENLRTEDAVMGAPLRRLKLTGRIAGYDAIMAEDTRLRAAYSLHVHRWGLREVEGNWAGYAESVRVLVAALRTVIRRRERELIPAAQRLLAARGAVATPVVI